MKKQIFLGILAVLLFKPAFSQQLSLLQTPQIGLGQSTETAFENEAFKPKKKKKKKKSDDEKPAFNWKEKLWYGGNFNLQFNQAFGQSQFLIGVAPMVGYKIIGPLSVGPRIGLDYGLQREQYTSTQVVNTNVWNKTLGLFGRVRVWNLFLHGEIDQFWQDFNLKDPKTGEKITGGSSFGNQFVGIGWNEGRERDFGFEATLLYDFRQGRDKTTTQLPIEYRIGFTYNF